MARLLSAVLAAWLAATPVLTAPSGDAAYGKAIEEWRARREERLRSETGWLAVAGLYWLEEGTHTVGRAEGSAIRFRKGRRRGSAP